MAVERSRQIQRFLRALVRHGQGEMHADGTMTVYARNSRDDIKLNATLARHLLSQGLVTRLAQRVMPTAAAPAWLKREMADSDGFAAQHRTLVTAAEGPQVNLASDVLLRLGRAESNAEPFLQPHQLAAGARVTKWAERSQLRARVTMSYTADRTAGRSGASAGHQADLGDMAVEARKQLASIHKILPRECAEVVMDVCVYEKGLQKIETERGWPRRSAKLVLRIGLDLMARHLELSPNATGTESRQSHNWREAGARPTIFE